MVAGTVPPNPIGGTTLKSSAAASEALAKSTPSRSSDQLEPGNPQAAAPAGRNPQRPFFSLGAPTPVQVLVGVVAGVLLAFLLAVLATALASRKLVRGVTRVRPPALLAREQTPVFTGKLPPPV